MPQNKPGVIFILQNRDLDPFKSGVNTLGKYTSLNQMLKNGYYYIPGDVAANYVGYLIVAGYDGNDGVIRKTQYLIQDAGFKWRTVSGTLVSPSFGEWRTGVTTSDFKGTVDIITTVSNIQTGSNYFTNSFHAPAKMQIRINSVHVFGSDGNFNSHFTANRSGSYTNFYTTNSALAGKTCTFNITMS